MNSLNPSDYIKSMLGVGNKTSDSEHSLISLNKNEEILNEKDQKLLEIERTSSSSSSISTDEKCNQQVVLDDALQEIQFSTEEICRENFVNSSNVLFVMKENLDSCLETQNITHSIIASSDWGKSMPHCELITVHKNNKFIAYVINGNTASGRRSSVVRIQNMGLGKISLSCFHELVLELEFAWVDELILAVIDQSASLFIFNILNPASDQFESKLQIRINVDSTQVIEFQRLTWIKYICLDQEDQTADTVKLYLAQSRNNEVVVWNIKDVIQKKAVELVHYNDIKSQCFIIEPHPKSILDMKISPNGTTVATTCLDGVVRFYEINFQERESLNCVFQWSPHNAAPVNFIFFLDDHFQQDSSVCKFWEFVVTCSSQLGEFKLSNCVTWSCIQTISIHLYSVNNDLSKISFKMIVHPGSMCIALLDARNKSVFLLKRKKKKVPTATLR